MSMPPLSFPPEITALIVAEIASQKPAFLSSLILAWPNVIPFVREHRFKKIEIGTPKRLESFIAISSPGVMFSVRRARFWRSHHPPLDIGRLSQLVSTAVNLEEIELCDFEMDSINLALLASLRACTHLTTVCLSSITSQYLPDIFPALQLLPRLVTFKLCLTGLQGPVGSISHRMSGDTLGLYPSWNVHNLEAPPIAQVSCLELTLYALWDLLILDLIASPKTPFPNLRSIKLYSLFTFPYHPSRLCTLLGRYNASLRLLEIGGNIINPMSPEPESFTLPPNLESFKFSVHSQSHLGAYYQALSSSHGSLTTITMCLRYLHAGMWPTIARLDAVLAGLDLDRLNIEGSKQHGGLVAVIEKHFPRCVERYTKGYIGRDTYIFHGK